MPARLNPSWPVLTRYDRDHLSPLALPLGGIAAGLRHGAMGARHLSEPELQLGLGCLVDQLVGQFMAHVCGLGHLLDPKRVRRPCAAS